ncbi:MAG: manganese efflux pump MntP [Vulcanimicrobiaceae bacterium]
MPLLKTFAVAFSLALDVFAVSVGVGVRGVPRSVKIRIGIAFALAEIVMNVLGAVIGAVAGRLIGDFAGYIGFIALIGLGLYMIREAVQEAKGGGFASLDLSRGWGLFVAALSISLDSLGIGFSILYIGVPVTLSLLIIGIVSVLSTTLGLTLGRGLGLRAEENAELWSGIILTLTGAAFIALKVFHIG